MIGKLDESLSFHSNALRLRSERQQVLASNIANADTPGYQSRDFDFSAALRAATGAAGDAQSMMRSDLRHLPSSGSVAGQALKYRMPAQDSLDGNSVDMDLERGRFVDNAVRYESALRFLNHKIKTLLSAIQG